MRTILICGDRFWSNEEIMLAKMVELGFPKGGIAFLVHGGAKGADQMSERLAIKLGFPKERILRFDAGGKSLGKAAGPIRNRRMFRETMPDEVYAFHEHPEKSKGTVDMADFAEKNGARVWRSWST